MNARMLNLSRTPRGEINLSAKGMSGLCFTRYRFVSDPRFSRRTPRDINAKLRYTKREKEGGGRGVERKKRNG